MNDISTRRLAVVPLGLNLGGFIAPSLLGCILLGLIVGDGTMHRPWRQFLPGFGWLTARSVVIGLIWMQVYAWWTALVFVSLSTTSALGAANR